MMEDFLITLLYFISLLYLYLVTSIYFLLILDVVSDIAQNFFLKKYFKFRIELLGNILAFCFIKNIRT